MSVLKHLTPRHQELLVRGYTDIYPKPGDGQAGDVVCAMLSPNMDKGTKKDHLLSKCDIFAGEVQQNNRGLERLRADIEHQQGLIEVSKELMKHNPNPFSHDLTLYRKRVKKLMTEVSAIEKDKEEKERLIQQMQSEVFIVDLVETDSESDSSNNDADLHVKNRKESKEEEAKRKEEEEARAKRMAPLREKYAKLPRALGSRQEENKRIEYEREIERLKKVKRSIATTKRIKRIEEEVKGLSDTGKISSKFKKEKEKLEKLNKEIFDLARERIQELKPPQVTVSEPVKKRKQKKIKPPQATDPPAKKPKTKEIKPPQAEEKPANPLAKKQALPMSTSETYETSKWGRVERKRRLRLLSKHFKAHLSCPVCDRQMTTFQCLQSHLSTKDDTRCSDSEWGLDTRGFKCFEPECFCEFGYRSGVRRYNDLKNHYKNHHSELGEMAHGLQFYNKEVCGLETYRRRLQNVMDLSFRLHYYRTVKGEEIKDFRIELNSKDATASFQRSGKWEEYVL